MISQCPATASLSLPNSLATSSSSKLLSESATLRVPGGHARSLMQHIRREDLHTPILDLDRIDMPGYEGKRAAGSTRLHLARPM